LSGDKAGRELVNVQEKHKNELKTMQQKLQSENKNAENEASKIIAD
jgi:ElaB/YqjD/DUF883 family membrane-anchored ribosome-binding protein